MVQSPWGKISHEGMAYFEEIVRLDRFVLSRVSIVLWSYFVYNDRRSTYFFRRRKMKSSRFLLISICLLCLIIPSAAKGKKVAPRLTPSQQALQADLVVVGRIVEIEEGDTEATAYQGANQKTAYKIANIK